MDSHNQIYQWRKGYIDFEYGDENQLAWIKQNAPPKDSEGRSLVYKQVNLPDWGATEAQTDGK